MPAYEYKKFPKVVYRGSTDDSVVINCEEERPEGYVDLDDLLNEPSEAELKAKAEEAKKEAKKAAAAERKAIIDYLDEHDVMYAKNSSLEKLTELKVALDEHLAKQGQGNDAG